MATPAYDDNNIIAKILRGEIPSKKVYEDDHVLAFEDIHPAAPVHTLIVPKAQYVSVTDWTANATDAEIASLMRAAAKVAAMKGVTDGGYRLISNIGRQGGQSIPHLHFHIIGGRQMGALVPGSSSHA